MAVFLFLRFGFMLLLIGLLSLTTLFDKNGFLTVNAAAYKKIEGSPLKIILSPPSKVVFKKLHFPLLLPCTPSIEENILVTWYRNDEKLQNAHIYGNGTLKLPPNDKANGIYRCLVNDTNLEYGALYSIQTIVEYPVTKRISAQNNQTAFIGESFLLSCPIESIPTANITWFFGNNSISNKFKENRYILLRNGSIFLKNITKEYQGKYKCIATNIYAFKKNRQITIHLFVIQSNNTTKTIDNIPIKDNLGQQLIQLMENNIQYIPIGENLILYCNSYDDVKIEWSFKQLNNYEFIKVNNNSKNFEIRNAAIDQHEGIYKCSTGSSSQEFRVIVTTPPVIDTKLNSYESSIAAPILFNCTVSSGNPLPNITWYRNGIQLETSYTIHINRSILRIQSLDLIDAGIYQCFARNIAGESVATGFIALRQMHNIESLPERPKNVKCYPVNANTLNVTFDSRQSGIFTMMNVYMASKNPSTWVANFPETLGTNDHFLIQRMLPIFEPFKLFLRSIIVTATRKVNGGQPESSVETSMLSEGIDCATQGLDIHTVIYQKGIFIWWMKMKLTNVKYYILQFLINDINDNTMKFSNIINGTTVPINSTLSHNEIEEKFVKIYLLKYNVIRNYENDDKLLKNNDPNQLLNNNDEIISIAVPNNVTGIFIPDIAKITVRIISINDKNEHLQQDYKYLQWKIFKDRTEVKIKSIESRSVNFIWNSLLKISCIYVCYINLNLFVPDPGIAECKNISMNSAQFSVTGLKPRSTYEMTFKECNNSEYFSNIEIYTKDDPPGPISNYTILRSKGLKLIWKPPINPNGKIKHYIIYWTFQNQTHETKIHPIKTTFKFPNVTEDDKFNITVRAVGDTGIGLPIYIDLNKISEPLVNENDSNILIDHTLGISIGVILSILCIIAFIFLFIRQRRRFKLSSPYTATKTITGSSRSDKSGDGRRIHNDDKNLSEFQIQRTSPTTRFPPFDEQQNFNPPYRLTDIQQEYEQQHQYRRPNEQIGNSIEFHEMQTLIPKQNEHQYHNNIKKNENIMKNGNNIIKQQRKNSNNENYCESTDDNLFTAQQCPIALCSSTPIPSKRKTISSNDNQIEIDLIPNHHKQQNLKNNTYENNKLTKISSSPNFPTTTITSTNNSNINNFNPISSSPSVVVNNTPEISSVPINISSLTSVVQPVESSIENDDENYPITINNDDSQKIFLPHTKHSIFLAKTDPKLVNGHDSPLKHSTDSNSNTTSPVDNNSQIKLLGYNNSFCDNNYCQNSTTAPINDTSVNCTESTFLNFDDSSNNSINNTNKNIIGNQIIKTNWNHRRPIVDPNG